MSEDAFSLLMPSTLARPRLVNSSDPLLMMRLSSSSSSCLHFPYPQLDIATTTERVGERGQIGQLLDGLLDLQHQFLGEDALLGHFVQFVSDRLQFTEQQVYS